MRHITVFLVLALAPLSFAQASMCDDAYDSCISECCDDCGSTLSTDSNGDLVCNVGTEDNPDQGCIDMCTPCSTQYQDCMSVYGGSTGAEGSSGNDDSGGSCCGTPIVFVALLGATFLKMR